ncbi:hypothetical protein [Nocardioides sp. GXZ039]|uniref:hypothetical protein n=1 Tax=Nocardioides sp. GXZ039 TaxID=3136018 RepID=UPI0030F3A38E
MLIVGLVIILIGVILVVGGLFTADVSGTDVEIFGIAMSPTILFLAGLLAGLCLLFGLSVSKFGAKRELKQRKEQRKIDDLSAKLDRAEARRGRDLDDPDVRN